MKQVIFIALLMLIMMGCWKEKGDISSQDLSNIGKIEKDSIYLDDDGNKVKVNVNYKLVDVSVSVNGPVVYSYDLSNGGYSYDKYGNVSKVVFKKDYWNDLRKIHISDDTIKAGETLHLAVWSKEPRYRIEILTPRAEQKTWTQDDGPYDYEFSGQAPGTYDLTGKISSDSASFEFAYKFIVQ
jgi:hypothetical protein